MNNNREDIVLSYVLGIMSDAESAAFEKELANDKELSDLCKEYLAVSELTNQLKYDDQDVNSSWMSFENQINLPNTIKGFDWLKMAASIAILAVFSYGMWFFGSTDISLTSDGNSLEEVLSDGTQISLNANSLITSNNYDNDNRELSLVGEATFKVAKSKSSFILHTSNGDIKVYGTEFNVFTDHKSDFTIVELYEGSIGFTSNDKEIVLKPGERLINDGNSISVSKFVKASTWSERISCNDVPLSYILGQLRLTYDINFVVKPKFLKEHYTINLPKDNLKACILMLNQVSGKNFALIDKTIVVK